MIGSGRAGMGSNRTARQLRDGGAGGGLSGLTSTDNSVVITNPNGPVPDLSVPAAAGGGWALELSYGDGNGSTDDDLPVSPESETTFWLGEGMDADHAGPLGGGQVREWPTHQWLTTLRLVAQIDYAQFFGDDWDGSRLVVTVDGEETGIEIAYSDVVVEDNYQTVAGEYLVAPGSKVGLKLVTVALGDGSKLRGHFRIVGGVTDAPEGPYAPETLTRRHETAAGFEIETDGDNLAVWPNLGSIGTSHDWIPAPGIDPLTVIEEDGARLVRLEGAQAARQRTVPASGEFAVPVGAQFAPFWCVDVLRIRDVGSGVLRWARVYPVVAPGVNLHFDLDVPLSGHFKLVWQFLGNGANNLQTVPNLDGDLIDEWAMLEWGYDGSAFRVFLNGAEVELAATNPAAGDAATEQLSSWIGSIEGVDEGHIDYKAQFSYSEWPTAGQRAQTRNYLRSTYPVLP